MRRTPVLTLEPDALGLGVPTVCKLDLLQPTGSFKVRGATNLLRSDRVGETGVVAASGGNFGLAVAWAAARTGRRATIVLPDSSPASKRDPLAALGAELEVVPGVYADALARAQQLVAETGAAAAHAYDQREVVAGQGTVARELVDQLDGKLDTVLVAVGGGGLVAGVCAALRDLPVRIVAVETERCGTLAGALAAGHPVDVEVGGLAVSALGARQLGDHAWAARRRIDVALTISDEAVADAQRRLWDAARLHAEPAGATALAALTCGAYVPAAGERVAAVVCGAN